MIDVNAIIKDTAHPLTALDNDSLRIRTMLLCSEKFVEGSLVASTPPLFLKAFFGEMGRCVSLLIPAMAFAPVSIKDCFPCDVEIAPR